MAMRFYFNIYLHSYQVTIESSWFDSLDAKEEKQKIWDDIREAHIHLSDYLKEKISSLQKVSYNEDFIIVVTVHDSKEMQLIVRSLQNNDVEFTVETTGETPGKDEYTFEIKCRGIAEAATAYLCITNDIHLIIKPGT